MWLIKGTAPILMYFWVLSFLALFCFGFSVYFICGFILLTLSTKMSLGFCLLASCGCIFPGNVEIIKLDGTLCHMVQWKVSLPMTGRLELDAL